MQVDELGQTGDRGSRRVPLDLGPAGLVAEHVQVRRAAVDQTHRHTGIDRVEDRALSFDPEEVAARAALDDEALGSTREEVRHDRVHRDPPSRDRDPGLPGRDEHRTQATPARLEIELAGRGHLPDRAVGADGEHDRRVHFQVGAGRRAEIGRRLAEIAELDFAGACELDELVVVREPDMETVLEVQTVLDATLQQRAPVGGEPAALRDDTDERGVRLQRKRIVDGGDDRNAVHRFAGVRRVQNRDDGLAPVAQDAAQRLAVMGVLRELLREDHVALL